MIYSGKGDIMKWRFDRIEKILLPNVKKLLAFFREHKLKVIYVTLGSKMLDYSDVLPHMRGLLESTNNREGAQEHEILNEIKPIAGEYVINKTTISAFWSSVIEVLLRAFGPNYLLFTGVSTNMCVEGTARDASDIGYKCVMIDDAVATSKEELHRTALVKLPEVLRTCRIHQPDTL